MNDIDISGIKKITEKIISDEILTRYISVICDMEFYHETRDPENAGGRVSYSIAGKAFAHDGSGGEFILLDDASVAYNGSEGQCGRIAKNLDEFFSLIINCSCFLDYTDSGIYDDIDELIRLSEKMEMTFADDVEFFRGNLSVPFIEAKIKIAEFFEVNLYENIAEPVLLIFYKAATQEPKFISYFKEKNGELTPSENII